MAKTFRTYAARLFAMTGRSALRPGAAADAAGDPAALPFSARRAAQAGASLSPGFYPAGHRGSGTWALPAAPAAMQPKRMSGQSRAGLIARRYQICPHQTHLRHFHVCITCAPGAEKAGV